MYGRKRVSVEQGYDALLAALDQAGVRPGSGILFNLHGIEMVRQPDGTVIPHFHNCSSTDVENQPFVREHPVFRASRPRIENQGWERLENETGPLTIGKLQAIMDSNEETITLYLEAYQSISPSSIEAPIASVG